MSPVSGTVRPAHAMPARALLLVFLVIELLDELVDGLLSAAWPLVRASLELDYAQIGLLLGVPMILGNALEPALGLLADRGHRRTLCLTGGLAFALALTLMATASGFWTLLAGFVLFYPASGAFVGLAQLEMVDLDGERRTRLMVLWTIVGCAGCLLGPVLLFVGFGWRVPLIALAVITLATTTALARMTHRRALQTQGRAALEPGSGAGREDASGAAACAGERDSHPGTLQGLLRALRRRAVRRAIGLALAADLVLDVLGGLLALYFVDALGASDALGGAAVFVFVAAMLVGNLVVLPRLEDTDPARFLRACAAVVLALLAALVTVDTVWAALALVAAIGLVVAAWYPLLQARLYDALPEATGTAMALHSAATSLFGVVPVALGAVAATWGIQAAVCCVALGPLVVLVVPLGEVDE